MRYAIESRPIAVYALWIIFLLAVVTDGQKLPGRENGKIAFSAERDGNREIYSINPDGSEIKRLTNSIGVDDYPAWSPDGQKVAYLSQESDGQYRIKTISADGDQQQTITSIILDLSTLNFCGEQFSISWSPDGKRIAFQEFGDIVTISIDGSDRQTIGSSLFRESEPAWGPTGILAYTLTLQGADDRNGLQIGTTEGSLFTRITVITRAVIQPIGHPTEQNWHICIRMIFRLPDTLRSSRLTVVIGDLSLVYLWGRNRNGRPMANCSHMHRANREYILAIHSIFRSPTSLGKASEF